MNIFESREPRGVRRRNMEAARVHGGSVSGGIDPTGGGGATRGVTGGVASGRSVSTSGIDQIGSAMAHPAIIASVFFFATEFGRMPWQLHYKGEMYNGTPPGWLRFPHPNNMGFPWRFWQQQVGLELELFGSVGFLVQIDPTLKPEDFGYITSIRVVSRRRYITNEDISDPEFWLYQENLPARVGELRIKERPWGRFTGIPDETGRFFFQLTNMTFAESTTGVSPYLLARDTISGANAALKQNIREWERDGRSNIGLRGLTGKGKMNDEAWEEYKMKVAKSMKVDPENPAGVPMFADQEVDVLQLGNSLKDLQGVEFANHYNSQLAMLGRIPELLIKMEASANPNYKIIRAIYNFFISSRVAPALESFSQILTGLLPEDYTLSFDLTDALRADMETLVNIMKQSKGLGVWSTEEMIKLLGNEPPTDLPDVRMVDTSSIPIDQVADLIQSKIDKNEAKNVKTKDDYDKTSIA